MKEFLIFVAIIIAIALVIELWPLLLVILIGTILFYFIKKYAEKEAAREAEERRIEEERRAEKARLDELERQRIEQEREQLTTGLRNLLNASNVDYIKVRNSIHHAPQVQKKHLVEVLDKKRKEIFDKALIDIVNAHFSAALEKLEVLTTAFPQDLDYSKTMETVKSTLNIVTSTKNYIMTDKYGEPNLAILEQIEKETNEENKTAITGKGVLYPLWFFTIKDPFDEDSFKHILTMIQDIKPQYFSVPVDVLLVMAYIEIHRGENIARSIYCNYKDLMRKYINESDKWALIEFASALSWIGNRHYEYLCLQRLVNQSNVPEYIKERFAEINHSVRIKAKENKNETVSRM